MTQVPTTPALVSNTLSNRPAPVATSPNPNPLSNLDRRDLLWKVIGRFDFYIGTTNTKAAFLIAFNTFAVSGIVLKWNDLLQLYGGKWLFAAHLTSILLAFAALASLASLFFTFCSVNPFLKSPQEPEHYHSAIYFGHIIQYDNPEKYLTKVRELDEEKVVKDLAFQAHVLAQCTSGKFKWIKWGVGAILFAQLPAFVLLILTVLYVLIANRYAG